MARGFLKIKFHCISYFNILKRYNKYTFLIDFLYVYDMIFEYDDNKSQSNKLKHGIDFEQAKALWQDTLLLEIPIMGCDEPRFLVIGMFKQKHYSAIITYRHNTIRLISVRRSRTEEVDLYEQQ